MRELSRREFCRVAVSTAAALTACTVAGRADAGQPEERARLKARPGSPAHPSAPGDHTLHLGGARDGFYVSPEGARSGKPLPLLVLLHGATQSAALWARPVFLDALAKRPIVMLAPDSRGGTWDAAGGTFGRDVEFIDAALKKVFDECAIDPTRIALGGFSDGASYALSLGVANGDLFSAVMAFSPGFIQRAPTHGHPRVFVSHGTADPILPINRASRVLVPSLERAGYDVEYREFDGGHMVPPAVFERALAWWLDK